MSFFLAAGKMTCRGKQMKCILVVVLALSFGFGNIVEAKTAKKPVVLDFVSHETMCSKDGSHSECDEAMAQLRFFLDDAVRTATTKKIKTCRARTKELLAGRWSDMLRAGQELGRSVQSRQECLANEALRAKFRQVGFRPEAVCQEEVGRISLAADRFAEAERFARASVEEPEECVTDKARAHIGLECLENEIAGIERVFPSDTSLSSMQSFETAVFRADDQVSVFEFSPDVEADVTEADKKFEHIPAWVVAIRVRLKQAVHENCNKVIVAVPGLEDKFIPHSPHCIGDMVEPPLVVLAFGTPDNWNGCQETLFGSLELVNIDVPVHRCFKPTKKGGRSFCKHTAVPMLWDDKKPMQTLQMLDATEFLIRHRK